MSGEDGGHLRTTEDYELRIRCGKRGGGQFRSMGERKMTEP
jgi:hypothetical protein